MNDKYIVLSWSKDDAERFTIRDRYAEKTRKFQVPKFQKSYFFRTSQKNILIAVPLVLQHQVKGERRKIYIFNLDAESPSESLKTLSFPETYTLPEQEGFFLVSETREKTRIYKMSFETLGETGEEAETQILANHTIMQIRKNLGTRYLRN